MKFNIELDLLDYGSDNFWNDADGERQFISDLREEVLNEMVKQIIHTNYASICPKDSIPKLLSDIVKENKEKIIAEVINSVSNEILRKKEIKEILPSNHELNEVDKLNEKYFLGLIDKAIAKKFKGISN